MPRRADITPRELDVDPVHGSKLVTQLINAVMLDGKRSTAERLVYDALAIVAERTGKPPVEALETAVKTVTPVLEVRSATIASAS
jgi:small subunit ribosomal protein S7